MSDLILHHYWESPYAEKVRRILGFKRLAWRSVIIPMIMPKPDLTALTGGYRKTPVLQLGADIYCDTDLIARTIDRLHPEPSLFPDAGAARALRPPARRDGAYRGVRARRDHGDRRQGGGRGGAEGDTPDREAGGPRRAERPHPGGPRRGRPR